jgi:hypothetical protein
MKIKVFHLAENTQRNKSSEALIKAIFEDQEHFFCYDSELKDLPLGYDKYRLEIDYYQNWGAILRLRKDNPRCRIYGYSADRKVKVPKRIQRCLDSLCFTFGYGDRR